MKSWTLLLALFLALAFTNLVVLARQAETEMERRQGPDDDDNDIDDGIDDGDDIEVKDEIRKAAGKLCRLFGEEDDKRDVMHIRKRGWLSKTWKKIKKTAKKVWDTVKPHVIDAAIGAVKGKREALDNFDLDADEKRALEEFARELSDDDALETLVRKRGWLKKTWNKIKDGVKKVVGKVGDAIQDAIKPHIPGFPGFQGKRGDLSETEELDEETRRALEEFSLVARDLGDSLDKRGKFWKTVKKVWKVVKPILKKLLKKREVDDDRECASLSEIREALDTLNTVVGMAEDVEGCGGDEDPDDDGDIDDDVPDDDDDDAV